MAGSFAPRPPKHALRALARIGQLNEAFADYLDALPGRPEALWPDQDPYGVCYDAEAFGTSFRDTAYEAYRLCVSKATEHRILDSTSQLCDDHLLYVQEKAPAEIRPQPGYLRLQFPTARRL